MRKQKNKREREEEEEEVDGQKKEQWTDKDKKIKEVPEGLKELLSKRYEKNF